MGWKQATCEQDGLLRVVGPSPEPWLYLSCHELPDSLDGVILRSMEQADAECSGKVDRRTMDALRLHFAGGCPSICLTKRTVIELLDDPPAQSYVDGPGLWDAVFEEGN